MSGKAPADVDAFIAAAPEALGAKLSELRAFIRRTLPQASQRLTPAPPLPPLPASGAEGKLN